MKDKTNISNHLALLGLDKRCIHAQPTHSLSIDYNIQPNKYMNQKDFHHCSVE